MTGKTGVLLLNLGSPRSPSVRDVRAYLRVFLTDPYVIDIPMIWRYLLIYALILPFRPKQSASAYQKIWTPQGSPLIYLSKQLKQKVATALGENYSVALAMRYGEPSTQQALAELQHGENLIIMPLFPQYALASTSSALNHTLKLVEKFPNIKKIQVCKSFYDDPDFIQAWAQIIKKNTDDFKFDKLIFSYHGLPVRQVIKTEGPNCHCDHVQPCPKINPDNQFCYRAQCYATTRLISEQLQLKPQQYTVSFQSRLGRTPWIKPYTDHLLNELSAQGCKNIAICCPSFVTDCLETLEEIGIRARAQWQQLGGEELRLIPCLNTEDSWVNALVKLIKKHDAT